MTVKIYVENPDAKEWDPKAQTIDEYCGENCTAWDDLTPEEQHNTAQSLNNMAMTALGYAPVKKGVVA